MDHQQATRLAAVDKYLLDELPTELRDEFEEHYFDCQDCAIDLRASTAFMDAARREFKANPQKEAAPAAGNKSRLWPSALVWSALAASLLLIAYQNLIVYPRFKTEIAEWKAPEILPQVSLVGGNSRGGQIPAATVVPGRPFLLLVDIPAEDRFSSYTCLLHSASGSLLWRVDVSQQQAKDTVSIRVPTAGQGAGQYILTVQGITAGSAVDLAHDRFTLNSQN